MYFGTFSLSSKKPGIVPAGNVFQKEYGIVPWNDPQLLRRKQKNRRTAVRTSAVSSARSSIILPAQISIRKQRHVRISGRKRAPERELLVCVCLHVENRSDLYLVPLKARTAGSSAWRTFFVVTGKPFQKSCVVRKENCTGTTEVHSKQKYDKMKRTLERSDNAAISR